MVSNFTGDKKRIGAANMPMYYSLSGHRTLALRMKVILKERVDKDILQSALEKTLKRYPTLQQTLISDGKNVFYKKNDKPIRVKADTSIPRRFCSEDTQGYLFGVEYDRDSFCLDMHHGLTDGKGFNEILKTLLYYYFSGCNYNIETEQKVKLCKDDYDPSETEYTFEKYADVGGSNDSTTEKNAYRIDEDELNQREAKSKQYTIRCSLDEVLSYSKKNQSSVAPVLADFISYAVEKEYDTGDLEVVGYLTADMRRYYDANTIENFSATFSMPYSKELMARNVKDRTSALKDIMKEQLTKEYFDDSINRHFIAAQNMFEAEGDFAEKTKAFKEDINKRKDLYTYCLTYVGKLDMPDSFLNHIETIVPYMPAFIVPFTISATTIKNEMTLVCMQDFESDKLVRALFESFRNAGIYAELSDDGFYSASSLEYKDIPIEG